MQRLKGKVALVTGAGRKKGIGYACAIRLAREGAAVVVSDRSCTPGVEIYKENRQSELEAIADDIAACGVQSLAFEADVTNLNSVEEMVATIKDGFGRLDILVNNAGISSDPSPLVLTDPEAWRKTIEVNLTGTMFCCRAAAPLMMDNETGGKIINMSSRAAHRGAIWIHAYCASKAGIIGLTRSMALELASFKICVNAICPGDIDTELKRWGWEKEAGIMGKSVEEVAGEAARSTPLGRIGTPEDVAAAVAFFASPDADYLTGEVLDVTGGQGTRKVF